MKRAALRAVARYGNVTYNIASAARQQKLRTMISQHPESFVRSPEEIERETAHLVVPTLQHVIEEVTSKPLARDELRRLEKLVSEDQEECFENYGEAIFINPHRIDDLLTHLGLPQEQKERFLGEARQHYLLRDYVYSDQATGHFASKFRTREAGNYNERPYSILTRDGRTLHLTRIVNMDQVKTNDDRPSLLFVPGIACNHKVFDLVNETSLALEHADKGRWVYLFDPRGLGKNKGEFDPECFFDTLISNDLPAAAEFTFNRPSQKKPVVLIGHSMGGMIAEFMLVRQAYKLNRLAREIAKMTGEPTFRPKGKTREEIAAFLDKTEAALGHRKTDSAIKALIAEARNHLDILRTIKGLITVGSPKIFDKNEHPIYPTLLWLNIFLPMLREEKVPIDTAKLLLKLMPSLTFTLRHLINSSNFADPKAFLSKFVEKGTDSFPLGVGFQLLKAVYSGKGMRRMDRDKFNYSAHLDEIPPDISIFHIVGEEDPLAPPFNLAFIDRSYSEGGSLDFAPFPEYNHEEKRVYQLDQDSPVSQLPLSPQKGQVTGFVVEGVSHLDFFDGKTAERVVRPLLHRLVDTIWQS